MINYRDKVTLGPLDSIDNELIRRWRNSPPIMRWCRQSTLISDREQEAWFERQKADPSIQMFMIYNPEEKPVGVCGLTSIDRQNSRAEFSLYISPNNQRCGYGANALSALLHHAFTDLNLNQVWGETFDENPALGIFMDLGFKCDGTRRDFYFKNGRYINCQMISILRKEWELIEHEAK